MNKTDLAEFVEWDVRNWSAALDFWSTHTELDLSRCSALELGSRNGGLSLWLALQGARVVCSDVQAPGPAVRERHQARGASRLMRYESIDATNIPYEDEFDLVVFKSVLGALGRGGAQSQAQAVRQMHAALKKGGELFFAENLTASALHRFLRRKYVRWGRSWRYVSVAEMVEFLAPFSKVQFRTLGFAGAFGRGAGGQNLLGILDKTILNHVIPENWRYIIVGVAKK